MHFPLRHMQFIWNKPTLKINAFTWNLLACNSSHQLTMDGYSPKTMRKSRGFNAPNRRIMLSLLYCTFLALISRPRRGRWCPSRTGRTDPHSLPSCSAARAPACSQYWARAVQSYDRARMREDTEEHPTLPRRPSQRMWHHLIIPNVNLLRCFVGKWVKTPQRRQTL